jgi:3-oxoadipate enol-lactonase
MQSLAEDIETVISKLNAHDIVLVGHSMGGKVAQLITGRKNVKGIRGLV